MGPTMMTANKWTQTMMGEQSLQGQWFSWHCYFFLHTLLLFCAKSVNIFLQTMLLFVQPMVVLWSSHTLANSVTFCPIYYEKKIETMLGFMDGLCDWQHLDGLCQQYYLVWCFDIFDRHVQLYIFFLVQIQRCMYSLLKFMDTNRLHSWYVDSKT